MGVDKPPPVWYNNDSEREVIKMKKDKRERKMTPEQLQQLLHMRSRGYVQKKWQGLQEKPKAQRKGK